MLFSQEVKAVRENKTKNLISDAQNRIKEINNKINDLSSNKSNATTRNSNTEWDWTNSYSKFQKYEDIEDLKEAQLSEQKKIEALASNFDNLGHYHDHSKEREMFEKSEEEKLKLCEQYRVIGNYLFHEGMFAKAAQQFQITIAYYEYCFPTTNEEQQQLNNLRHRCLCNISKCYIYLGNYRSALQSADLVIKESTSQDSVWLKALYRRAVAYRYLDEYDLALEDLKLALTHSPNDSKIIEEINKIKTLNSVYLKSKTIFAKQSIQIQESTTKSLELNTDVNELRKLHLQLINAPLEPIPNEIIQEWNMSLLSITSHKT